MMFRSLLAGLSRQFSRLDAPQPRRRFLTRDGIIRINPVAADFTPRLARKAGDGWHISSRDGVLCHTFSGWYDDCNVLPDGHVELTRRFDTHTELFRFAWCPASRCYRLKTLPPVRDSAFTPL